MIVVAVERDFDDVALDRFIAPRELRLNQPRLVIEHSHPDIDRVVIYEDTRLGILGGSLSFIGIVLTESGDRRGCLPGRFVQAPIDRNSSVSPGGDCCRCLVMRSYDCGCGWRSWRLCRECGRGDSGGEDADEAEFHAQGLVVRRRRQAVRQPSASKRLERRWGFSRIAEKSAQLKIQHKRVFVNY